MDDDTTKPEPGRVLDISDSPILERGLPSAGEDQRPWLGAMLRTVTTLIQQCGPSASWEQTRDGLDAVTLWLREEPLAGKLDPEPMHPNDVERLMRTVCPPKSRPQERARWARALGYGVMGIVYAGEQARRAAGDDSWPEVRVGVEAFVDYVRSEDGPLTWTVA